MGEGRWVPRIAAATLTLAGVGVASAHEVGGTRFDAPVPLGAVLGGAATTVALTAWWLAGASDPSQPRAVRLGTLPTAVVVAVRVAARAGFVFAFLLVLVAGVAGPQLPAGNFATAFVWSVWLKGVGLVAALVGSPWRVLSPWHTVYAALRRVEGEEVALAEYPASLGRWPALLAVLALGAVETLTVIPRSPRATAVVVAGYAAVMVAGAVVFGPTFLDRADGLAVLYRLFGRVAPFRFDRDGTVTLQPPWRGCTGGPTDLPLVGVVVAAVFVVSFDGFASTPAYQSLLFAVRGFAGVGPWAGIALYAAGFGLFCGALVAVATLTARVAGGSTTGALRALAPTVVPIAVAYEAAHNYPLVARGLGRTATRLVGYVAETPPAVEPLAWLSLPAFWGSQALLVVAGHVVAVVAAHRVTADRYPVGAAHAPLTALMVAYTVLSLWIISRPVVA